MDYKNSYTGEVLTKKPEHMTSLYNSELVYKNHPRIVLRGLLDELKAKVLVYMAQLYSAGKTKILTDFEEVLTWVKTLQRSEVTGDTIENLTFHGMDLQEIQERSHNPQKYYKVKHLFNLDYKDNIDVLKINELKAFARRVEIAAFTVFFEDEKVTREDFLLAANRLSSLLYLIELQIMSEGEK